MIMGITCLFGFLPLNINAFLQPQPSREAMPLGKKVILSALSGTVYTLFLRNRLST